MSLTKFRFYEGTLTLTFVLKDWFKFNSDWTFMPKHYAIFFLTRLTFPHKLCFIEMMMQFGVF